MAKKKIIMMIQVQETVTIVYPVGIEKMTNDMTHENEILSIVMPISRDFGSW
jgi:hypothetical protein